jgi:phenylpropionate dioxygenase-like ring-hydroxylating dioxygenase large terminal subunit
MVGWQQSRKDRIMYPLATAQPWPLNQWYIAGFAREVGSEMLARTFLNRRVVLFRDGGGAVHALSAICPHRMMPMELGKLEADRLICAYHGLAFDLGGKCVDGPSKRVPDCALTRYPVKEDGGLLWIWLGEPYLAEQSPLPPQVEIGIGADGWTTQFVEHQILQARYMLLMDNLFDLSHLCFIHASLLGSDNVGLLEPKLETRAGRLVFERTMEDVPTDQFRKMWFPHMGDRMSSRLETELLGISLINAGGPYFDGSDCTAPLLGHQNFIHALTPETEKSTHYWTIMTRDFRIDDAGFSAMFANVNSKVVAQDIEALEAIEDRLGQQIVMPAEISMRSDLGGLQARARIIRMIDSEASTQG